MRVVLKGIVVLAVLMMVSGSALAFDIAYHVKQAPNGKGDVLIFPSYFAAPGGWETKLTVINTSGVYSTISKVIFRSHYYSQELLDFLIYLSPNDVWTGYIRHDGTNVYVYSEDDSVLINPNTFASKSAPMRQNLFAIRCPTVISTERTTQSPKGDSAEMGYVEVIETWYGNVGVGGVYPAAVPNTLSIVPPVSKEYLRQLYPAAGAAPVAGAPAGLVAGGNNSGGIDHTVNVLAGYQSIQNLLIPGMASMMPATALADFDNNLYLGVAAVSGIQFVSQSGGPNSLGEVEAALSKDYLAMPYLNNPSTGELTVHLFNFPTKNSNYTLASTTLLTNGECSYQNPFYPTALTLGGVPASGVGDTPFWTDPTAAPPAGGAFSKAQTAYRCLAYGSAVYDLSENTTGGGVFSGGGGSSRWCEEMEMVLTSGYSSIFTEGWTNYTVNYTGRTGQVINPVPVVAARNPAAITLAYAGTPVIASALIFKTNGIDHVYGAYTPGDVYAVRNPALNASGIGFAAGQFVADYNPGNATYNYISHYQFSNAINPLSLGIHTILGADNAAGGAGLAADGYPQARSAAAAACAADIYWDNTAGVNQPCLPVQSPK